MKQRAARTRSCVFQACVRAVKPHEEHGRGADQRRQDGPMKKRAPFCRITQVGLHSERTLRSLSEQMQIPRGLHEIRKREEPVDHQKRGGPSRPDSY